MFAGRSRPAAWIQGKPEALCGIVRMGLKALECLQRERGGLLERLDTLNDAPPDKLRAAAKRSKQGWPVGRLSPGLPRGTFGD